jgi:metallo-beta-lactamase family protein
MKPFQLDGTMAGITFFGAAKTVTGSRYLLEMAGKRILVDCGLFQGPRALRDKNWEPFLEDAASIDAILITHAHLDHSGYLPLIVKQGFKGHIFLSHSTAALAQIIVMDSAKIQEEDAAYANKKGFSKHKPALPLYTIEDAEKAFLQFSPVDFNHDVKIGEQITARFSYGGHILGASIVTVFDGKIAISFSGDLGRNDDTIMMPPQSIKHSDYVTVESTYGDRQHSDLSPEDELEQAINPVLARGGVVLIPAFAVGRTQSVLLCLYHLKKNGRIPDVPVYLNSPMAINVTELYAAHASEHRLKPDDVAGMCNVATYITSVEESKKLNEQRGPMIILAASGMLEGGRILHHIKVFGPDSKNAIVFTGYQGVATRGRTLSTGKRDIKIHGQVVRVEAEIKEIVSMSAHSDKKQLIEWLSHFEQPPKQVFITHGEEESALSLKKEIEASLKYKCLVPNPEQYVKLS